MNRHGSSNERRGAWSVLLGDPQGNQNDDPTDIDNDVGETDPRDGWHSRGGTIQPVGVETHPAADIAFAKLVIGIVQRRAEKRPDQDREAECSLRRGGEPLTDLAAPTKHGPAGQYPSNL